ncbi:MAG: winged helix-turn-helix domain-containing protein [Colwellia sp.]|nr:winged helix-turn-helix domain-containing protein [Colwellia sp.]
MNIIERNASYTGNNHSITLPINRNDIANLLGLRRETLSRFFSKLQKNQLIQMEGKKTQLISPEKLSQLAGF